MWNRLTSFIKFWFALKPGAPFPLPRYYDEDDDADSFVDGYINIQYLGVVNENHIPMPAHKYVLSYQRKEGAKYFARFLYNFDQDNYKEDMKMTLTKMRMDIHAYYKKLKRS